MRLTFPHDLKNAELLKYSCKNKTHVPWTSCRLSKLSVISFERILWKESTKSGGKRLANYMNSLLVRNNWLWGKGNKNDLYVYQCITKQGDNKDYSAEQICDIQPSTWQSMLDIFLIVEDETWSNWERVLQQDDENKMDGTTK